MSRKGRQGNVMTFSIDFADTLVHLTGSSNGDTTTVTLTRFHADWVAVSMSDVELKLALSRTGDVIGGTHLGQHWSVERK